MLDTSSVWPPILSAPLLALLLWCVATALGLRMLKMLRVPVDALSFCESGLVSLAIGTGTIQYVPYALAAFGVLSPRTLACAFGLLTLLLLPDLARIGRGLVRQVRGFTLENQAGATLVWAGLLLALLTLLLIRALALGAFGSDDDGYHLSAPKRWLEAGTLRYLPSYTNTNASLGFEMLYLLGLATANTGVKLLHFSAGLFTLLALALVARRLGNAWAGLISISLLLIATPICNLPFLFGVAYVDFGACWMTLTSVLLWLVWRAERRWRLLVCLALCAGFAGSFKSTALSVGIAWAPLLIYDARQQRFAWSSIAGGALALGLVAFLPICPWLFRSWHLTGNPVFPMLSSVIPTRAWNPEIARTFGRFFHYYSWGVGSGSSLTELQRKAIVGATATGVVLLGAIAVLRLRDTALRSLSAFATVFVLVSVLMTGMVFRYWLPGIMCAVLIAACWLGRAWVDGPLRRRLPALILSVALMVELTHPASGRQLADDIRIAAGVRNLDQAYADEPSWRMWRFINAHTEPGAGILVAAFYTTFGAANYGCFWLDGRNCFTTDSHMQSFIQLQEWQSFRASLKAANIGYVLISRRQFSAGRHGFVFTAGQNEYPFCRRLADTRGEKLAQFGYLEFYRINQQE